MLPNIRSFDVPRVVRNVSASAALLGAVVAGQMSAASASEREAASLDRAPSTSRLIDAASLLGQQSLVAGGNNVTQDTKTFSSVMVVMPDVKNDKTPIPASAFNGNTLTPVLSQVKKYVADHADEKPVVSVKITGMSSDPYRGVGPDAEIGVKSAPNTKNDLVAQNYSYAGKLGTLQISASKGVQIANANVTLTHKQDVWTTDEQEDYKQLRKDLGYATDRALLTDQKAHPDTGGDKAEDLYEKLVTNRQGAIVEFSVETTQPSSGGGSGSGDETPSSSPTASPSATPTPSSTTPTPATSAKINKEQVSEAPSAWLWAIPVGSLVVASLVALGAVRRRRHKSAVLPPKVSLVRNGPKHPLPMPPSGQVSPVPSKLTPPAGAQANSAPVIDDDSPLVKVLKLIGAPIRFFRKPKQNP